MTNKNIYRGIVMYTNKHSNQYEESIRNMILEEAFPSINDKRNSFILGLPDIPSESLTDDIIASIDVILSKGYRHMIGVDSDDTSLNIPDSHKKPFVETVTVKGRKLNKIYIPIFCSSLEYASADSLEFRISRLMHNLYKDDLILVRSRNAYQGESDFNSAYECVHHSTNNA